MRCALKHAAYELGHRHLVHDRVGMPHAGGHVRTLRIVVDADADLMAGNPHPPEVPSLQRVSLLGESVAAGVPRPWSLLRPLSAFLTLIFVVDASVTARRKAMIVGGSVAFFLLIGGSMALLVAWAGLKVPQPLSLYFLAVVGVTGVAGLIGYELSRDLLRASELVDRLQASEAGLRESEARMSLALDAGDLGLWIWHLTRNEFWASERWRTLFGFAPSEHLHFDTVLQRLHPDDREKLRLMHAKAIEGSNEGRYQTEYRLLQPDGATRWISSWGRVECDAAGQPILMRGTSREITAHKLAEEEMRLLQQEIAHAGRVSMMGQLASGLAHEINQPLAAILRNAEAAEMYLQHPSPDLDEIRAILADIRVDDERACQVIDRMRGLLKRHTLDTRRLDVGSLVVDVAALLRVEAASRQVKLDVRRARRSAARPWRPRAYPAGTAQPHSQRHGRTPRREAGGSMGQRDRAGRCRVGTRRSSRSAWTTPAPVSPPDRLAQIFDPFFTTKPNGMGMGLAISRTIIESHGGRIWAENKSGGGAAFRFTLPIAEANGMRYDGERTHRSHRR